MGVLDTLRTIVDDSGGAMYECRNCGEKAGTPMDNCPHCGSTEISHYEF